MINLFCRWSYFILQICFLPCKKYVAIATVAISCIITYYMVFIIYKVTIYTYSYSLSKKTLQDLEHRSKVLMTMVCSCKDACTCTHTHTHTHACRHCETHMHACIHTYIRMHAYTHAQICTYVHTHKRTYVFFSYMRFASRVCVCINISHKSGMKISLKRKVAKQGNGKRCSYVLCSICTHIIVKVHVIYT